MIFLYVLCSTMAGLAFHDYIESYHERIKSKAARPCVEDSRTYKLKPTGWKLENKCQESIEENEED